MTKKTGRNRRFIITKNLIMMLVVLVVGLLAVWSWFTINRTVTASNISVKAAFPNEIGLANVRYNSAGEDIGPDVFSGQLTFTGAKLTKDCTGDGETLIVPDFSIIKDKNTAIQKGRQVNIGGVWEEALSQIDEQKILNNNPEEKVEARYVEIPFYARAQTKSVNLAATSYLTAPDEANLSNANGSKKSAYGSFSPDSIVGAVRVALLARGAYVTQTYESGAVTASTVNYTNTNNETNERHLTCLWLPRPDLHLNVTNTGLTTDWTLSRGLNDPDGATYKHVFYKPVSTDASPKTYTAKNSSGDSSTITISKDKGVGVEEVTWEDGDDNFAVTSESTVSGSDYPTLGKTVDISNVSESDYLKVSTLRKDAGVPSSTTDYYVFRYTLRIWLEGEDLESRRAMDSGEYNLHLEFR